MSHADRHRSPTVVLLLPVVLETFARRPLAEELLRADAVVAVDPPRVGYRRGSRWPAVAGVLAQRQAKRLRKRLPGVVGAVVIFDPGQARLGSELAALEPGAELFYGPPDDVDAETETHLLATERAALVFTDADPLRDAVADVLLGERA